MSLALNHSSGPARSDSDLVFAALSGSISAFEELQRQYSPVIRRKILWITRNQEDADDVLQDTFLRAYINLQSFEGRSTFKTWLTKIAINSALMLVRKRRVQAKLFVERTASSENESYFVDLQDSSRSHP
jgi:RNA polymerase sigma-70 factor, ECF subfamily